MMTNKYNTIDKAAWLEEVESWEASALPEVTLDDAIAMLEDHVRCACASNLFSDLGMVMLAYDVVCGFLAQLDTNSAAYMTLENRVDDILPLWFIYWQQSYEEYLNRTQPLAPYNVH